MRRLVVGLGLAVAVAAALAFGGRTISGARETILVAPGDTLQPQFSVTTSPALKVIGAKGSQRTVVVSCASGLAEYLRTYRKGVQVSADTIALVCAAPSPVPTPTPAPSVGHPNEPAGFTKLAFDSFDSLNVADMVCCKAGGQGISIVVDSTSPEGSKNVGQATYPANFPSGIAPGGIYPVNTFASQPKQLYVSFWVKLSSNWVGNAAGANKILYTQIDQNNRGSIEFVAMGGLDGTEQTLAPMMVLENVNVTPGAGSSGTPSATLVPNQVPYAASIAYQRGTWGHYEVLMTMNSAPGVADGGIKWWWNGQLYGDFTGHVDWNITASSGFNTVYWEPTYGGGGPAVPAQQWMRMKNLYISGK